MSKVVLEKIRSMEHVGLVIKGDEPRAVPSGMTGHQGDVYISPVDETHAHGEKWPSVQVATGNTKGSRHIVAGKDVEIYHGIIRPPYSSVIQAQIGPFIYAPYGFTLEHPQHPWLVFEPGCYQVTYQLDFLTQKAASD